MADWKTSLERLQRACANPREQLDRYLEQGKQVVGCFAPYAPEELVHAAGLIPMGMWGGRTELKLAKSYLPAFACPIMQANMELGLKGAYQGISAVIIPTMCDTLRCMTQNWRFGMKDIPMIPIVYPQNRTSPASVDYLISEFETVLTILYTITGNMVSEKSMEEAIAVYNQHNATMREFDTAANDHLDVITPKVRHVVHKSAFFFEKGEHTALVQEIIAGLKELPAHHWTGNKIILAGILCEPEEVLDILEEKPLVEEVTGKEDTCGQNIHCDHVSFAYANTQESGEEDGRGVLRDFTADFTEKRIHGILGKSGCGKSTLLKLLMRFYEPDEGVIAYDGTKIGEINTAVLRGGISYVTQETFLFHDTVAENLKVAKEDATEEELERAARAASIHDLIMSLPDGYETKIAELGSSLSGGERQRLGIARAFLHDADILFLDEPTSNIDSLNEGMILRSLKEECADKTILMVSHRKSTMGIADDVLEM